MAFTVTSPKITCSVTTTTAISTIANHGTGVYAYISYTKGTEGGLVITPSTLNPTISSSTYYNMVKADAAYALSNLTYSIAATGTYKIPFTLALSDTKLKLTFSALSGTASGSIAIDFFEGE